MSIPSDHVRDYQPEVRSLLRALKAAGIKFRTIDDGGGDAIAADSCKGEMGLISAITAADDCRLTVVCPDGKCRRLYLVFGNSPGELVSDYVTGCPALESVIEAEAVKWESRRQPTKFCQFAADRAAFNARARAYSKYYAACQAGGMSAGESHEYASDLASRGADWSVPLADRMAKRGGDK